MIPHDAMLQVTFVRLLAFVCSPDAAVRTHGSRCRRRERDLWTNRPPNAHRRQTIFNLFTIDSRLSN